MKNPPQPGAASRPARCARALARRVVRRAALATFAAAALAGCATVPPSPYETTTAPTVRVPIAQAGVIDGRDRFREILCAVLDARGNELPDHRPCEEALNRVGGERPGSGRPVDLGPSRRGLVLAPVPGLGYDCFERWLAPQQQVAQHLARHGFGTVPVRVGGLSGSEANARMIRDALMAMPAPDGPPRIVLVGYSKGAPDALEAVVRYPEIGGRVAALVSVAGAVGGSPLANEYEDATAELLRYVPGATCTPGEGGVVRSLQPAVRLNWLAENPLPPGIRYYSVVTLPQPDRVSWVLEFSRNRLSQVDGRNDSQVLAHDQIVPGSTLLGYLNADHWAIAIPIARTHETVASLFVTRNDFPREALTEAVLRFIEEDLNAAPPR
jgi:pimeloyl-ACP methyl ester carboxylesterase